MTDEPLSLHATVAEHVEVIDDLKDAHKENREMILANSDKNAQIASKVEDWSSLLSTPVGKIVAGMVISLLTLAATWLSGKLDSSKVVPLEPLPAVVVNVPPAHPDPVKQATPPTLRYTYAVFKDTQLPKDAQPGPVEVYPAGTTWQWQGKQLALPVQVTWTDGAVTDVKELKR